MFYRLQKGKINLFFPHPLHAMLCRNFERRGGGGVWILLFSEVALFEHNVSTILSPIVGVRKFNLHLILTCNMYIGRCIWSSACSATSVHVN